MFSTCVEASPESVMLTIDGLLIIRQRSKILAI
jgi:hypothetical protein